MNLRGLTVCVNYPDLLAKSIARWHEGLDRLIVVTDTKDKATHELCDFHNVEMYKTDVFYENGAKFNKGAALSECVLNSGLRGHAQWLLAFDADIIPPEHFRVHLERAQLHEGMLYGARRYQQPENVSQPQLDLFRRMPQSWVLGFFMCFHAHDENARIDPMFDMFWPHAGNYDTTFCRRWPKSHQNILSLPCIHLGRERENWVGRQDEQKAELREMLSKRHGHEDWERERMSNPPTLRRK